MDVSLEGDGGLIETSMGRFWLQNRFVSLPLKYLPPDITSHHTQRNEYSLKMNVFFCLKAEKAHNFST